MNVLMYCRSSNPFWCLSDTAIEALRKNFLDVQFLNAKAQEELEKALPDAEIYFGYRLDAHQLSKATKLRWIHVPAANVYGLVNEQLRTKGIILTNSRGMHAIPIAEHVLGAMLVFSRKFLECWRFQQQHHYASKDILAQEPPLGELRDKTAVILGLGGIGKEVAKLCKAVGMRVLATKRTVDRSYPEVDHLYPADRFREILPQADYLVIAIPRTPENDHLIGERELLLLKPTSVLINIARAQVVQHDALLQSLRTGKIRGAALDVFEQEPLPSDSELFDLPNVFLTPHVSGVSTEEHWPRLINLFEQNLRRFLGGEPLLNVVDLEKGY